MKDILTLLVNNKNNKHVIRDARVPGAYFTVPTLKNVIKNKESINKKKFNQSSVPLWFVKALKKNKLNLKEIIENVAEEPSIHLVFKKIEIGLISICISYSIIQQ